MSELQHTVKLLDAANATIEQLRASRDAERERAENNEQMWDSHKETVEIQAREILDLTAKLEAMTKEANHHIRQRAYEVEASTKLKQHLAASELAAYDMNCTIAALKQQLAEAQVTIARMVGEAESCDRDYVQSMNGVNDKLEEVEAERDQLQATVTAQQEEIGRLREVIQWAMGEHPTEDFPSRGIADGLFWWRKKMGFLYTKALAAKGGG